MQIVGSWLPQLGRAKTFNLLLQTGFIEVINDTNFAQIIQLNTGQCLLPPQMAQIYPTPENGGTINITCINPITIDTVSVIGATTQYNNMEIGPVNLVSVNQYLDGEVVGTRYPFPLVREVAVSRAYLQVFTPVNTPALSSGLSATLTSGGNQPGSFLYIWGWDLSVDREGTAGHSVVVDVNGLQGNNTIEYYYRTSTTDTINASIRYPQPIQAATAATNIQVVVQAVASSTAKAALTAFGFYAQ